MSIVAVKYSVKRNILTLVRNISIRVKQGTVIGETSVLPNGNPYHAFKGVPYAVPPIGELRFKPPVPLEKFQTDELDCTEEGDLCLQRDPFTSDIVGSENCLFLNIYTPKLKSDKPLPVIVWIHGGSFLNSSGNSDMFLPIYLIQEDVIVVTLNYRLGMLGFLYVPDGDIPGNAGLKDQLLALKWVRQNINRFNGDPNNITLSGQSAGASSVHLHLLSENSKKFFHKAICQSGTANMEWVIQMDARERTHRLANLMGFKSGTDKEAVAFLQNQRDPIEMLKHSLSILSPDERRRGMPFPFKPVLEEQFKEAIVTLHPFKAHKQPNSIDIPIMMGYTSDEGITMLPNATRKIGELDQDLAKMIPRSVNLEPDDPRCLELADDIRKFYFDGNKITLNKLKELTDLMTDYHFGIAFFVIAEIHGRYQHKSPLYFYRFSYDGELNLFKKLLKFGSMQGASHCDDLFYLFKSNLSDETPREGSDDEKVMKSMCCMWTNFAKYGNPTPDNDTRLPFKWTPVKSVGQEENFVLDYLEIDRVIRMEKNPEKRRVDFWKGVFKKYNKSFLRPKLSDWLGKSEKND